MADHKGKLLLIPCTLGDIPPREVLPDVNIKKVKALKHFIVENEKAARRFLKAWISDIHLSSIGYYPLNKHTDPGEMMRYLDPAEQGEDIGLISDAGCPAVADPGSEMVCLAHHKGIEVEPLVGPSSVLLALMGSGMNGQRFMFHGYLPIHQKEKSKFIRQLEKQSLREDQTQIFMDTPFRNNHVLEALLKNLQGETQLCIATDITLPTSFIKTMAVKDWKRNKPDLHKRPCMFLLNSF